MRKAILPAIVAVIAVCACTSEVNVPPVAVLAGPDAVRVNSPAVFDASKSTDSDGYVDPASYTFDFGDGSAKATGVSSASHTYAKKGDYTVTVEIKDDKGASSKAAKLITVTDNVTPVAKIAGPAVVRKGKEAVYDASGSADKDGSITGWSFDFGDKTQVVAGAETASHVFAAAGTYLVKVTVTDNDGATATSSIQVTVTDNVPPVASLKGPTTARIKAPVSFDASDSTDTDGTIASYSFDFGDGGAAVTGVEVAQHAYAAAGSYSVKVEVTDNEGAKASATVQILITANVPPTASFTGPTTAVVGDVVAFDASGSTDSDGAIASYSFDFGDATAAGTSAQVNHAYAAAGVFDVKLTVTDSDGATATMTRQITVTTVATAATPPTAIFTAPGKALVNQAVSFNGSSSMPGSGQITGYAWDFGDGSAAGSGAVAAHTYTAAQVYNVKLTVSATQKDATTVLTNAMTQQIVIEDTTVSIASITPNQGTTSGGTAVVIKGKGFTRSGATTLQFGGANALAVDVIDQETINAVTPPGSPGPANVYFQNDNGSIILAGAYAYLGAANRATTTYCPVLLKTGGTDVGFAVNDDDVNLALPLPFDFEFYGRVYPTGSNLRVATNGWISFNDMGATFTTYQIPDTRNPATLVAPFFMDLTAGANGKVYWQTSGTAPDRVLAIAWRGFNSRANPTDVYTFEVLLYESSNDIKFQYLNTYGGTLVNGTQATAGIQSCPTIPSCNGSQAFRNTGTRGLAPGGRTYAFLYDSGAYSMQTDTTLSVYSTNPANNGTLSSTGNFTVSFSAPLNPTTVTSSTIQLVDTTTSTTANVNLSVSGDKQTVTGTPASPMVINDKYRITVAGDLFGANKIKFSQDPTQVACGTVGTPSAFTVDFTATPGGSTPYNAGAGNTPYGIALNPTGGIAYIAKSNGNRLNTYNTTNNTVAASLSLSDCSGPTGVAVTPNGNQAFVTCNSNPGRVAVVNTSVSPAVQVDVTPPAPTNSIAVGQWPYGVAVRPAGDRAYVANSGSNNISVIDTTLYTVPVTVNVGNAPLGVAVNPAGTRLFVANAGDNSVSVVDVATGSGTENQVLRTVDVSSACNGPTWIAVRPDGARVFVTCMNNSRVAILDGAGTNALLSSIDTRANSNPLGIAISSAGTLAYVAESNTNSVGVIDVVAGTYLTWVQAGGNAPWGVVILPSSSTGLVTLSNSNQVAVIY